MFVVPAASGNPLKYGRSVVENLIRYGVKAELAPIAPLLKSVDYRKAANDPVLAAKIRQAGGIWFIGGEQRRITQALLDVEGRQTLALKAIWDAYRRGAVLGGSSAAPPLCRASCSLTP